MANLKSIKSLIHDNVLVCLIEERKNAVTVRVAGRPDIEAKAATLPKAEELLLLKLWELVDFDEPIGIRYEDARPAKAASEEQLYVIAPNEVADAADPGSYFKDGFCTTCQSGLGGRNAQILQLQHAPRSSASGIMVRFQPFLKCGRRVSRILLHTEV